MIGHDVLCLLEPEIGDLRQDFSLERDAFVHNDIVRRDPIRSDNEQLIPEIVNIAHLAAVLQSQSLEIGSGDYRDVIIVGPTLFPSN